MDTRLPLSHGRSLCAVAIRSWLLRRSKLPATTQFQVAHAADTLRGVSAEEASFVYRLQTRSIRHATYNRAIALSNQKKPNECHNPVGCAIHLSRVICTCSRTTTAARSRSKSRMTSRRVPQSFPNAWTTRNLGRLRACARRATARRVYFTVYSIDFGEGLMATEERSGSQWIAVTVREHYLIPFARISALVRSRLSPRSVTRLGRVPATTSDLRPSLRYRPRRPHIVAQPRRRLPRGCVRRVRHAGIDWPSIVTVSCPDAVPAPRRCRTDHVSNGHDAQKIGYGPPTLPSIQHEPYERP